MSVLWFDGLLTQVADAGVYFLPQPDIEELLEAAAVNRFPCLRVNLRECTDCADLQLRIAGALHFPAPTGSNWDALTRALGQLRSPGTPGLVLVLEHSDALRAQATDAFKTAMQVLQAASADWALQHAPLWSFIVLDESEFDALD